MCVPSLYLFESNSHPPYKCHVEYKTRSQNSYMHYKDRNITSNYSNLKWLLVGIDSPILFGKEISKCQQKRSISSKFPICKNTSQIFLNIFFEGKFARFWQHLIFLTISHFFFDSLGNFLQLRCQLIFFLDYCLWCYIRKLKEIKKTLNWLQS